MFLKMACSFLATYRMKLLASRVTMSRVSKPNVVGVEIIQALDTSHRLKLMSLYFELLSWNVQNNISKLTLHYYSIIYVVLRYNSFLPKREEVEV